MKFNLAVSTKPTNQPTNQLNKQTNKLTNLKGKIENLNIIKTLLVAGNDKVKINE